MDLERAHAQRPGQGKGSPVVGFGWLEFWAFALRCDLAEEMQGIGFVTPFLMGPGELQRTLRLGVRLVHAAREQIHLAQPNHPEGMVKQQVYCHGLFNRLLQQ